MSERWHAILTPSERAGAIAMILLRCEDPVALGLSPVPRDLLARRDLLGLDDGVVLGLDERTMLLMPHGGVAIVREISAALSAQGIPVRETIDPLAIYPEASSEIEAWCLFALSVSTSPMAVDPLLEHNRRWAAMGVRTIEAAPATAASPHQQALDRLIHPPTVVAVGRANVGKSSLLNALVGRQVTLVADVAGTTRDHVGAPVDLGGLVVRWVDMPGIDERLGERDEFGIAIGTLAQADLILHCIDAGDAVARLDARLLDAIRAETPVIRVGTRSDIGEHPVPVDVRVSLGSAPRGIVELVSMIRDRLVPPDALADPAPWRFWASLGGPG